MHIEIDRDDLLKGLRALSAAVSRRPTIQIWGFVHVHAAGDRVTLSVDSSDVRLSVRVPGAVREEGEAWFGHRIATNLARELPRLPVTIRANAERVSFHVGLAQYVVEAETGAAAAAEEWKVNGQHWEQDFSLRAEVPAPFFAAATRRALGFVSPEETRPILNHVLLEMPQDRVRFVATNGHRMILADLTVPGLEAGGPVMLSPLGIRAYLRAAKGADTVEVAEGTNALRLRWGRCELLMRAGVGPYPNYQQVWPKESTATLSVPTLDLLGAVRRAQVMCGADYMPRTELDLSDSGVRVLGTSESRVVSTEQVAGAYEGDPLSIAFNADYMADTLAGFKSAEVRLGFTKPERAVTVEAEGEEVEGERWAYLVMPLRLLGERQELRAA